MSFFGTFEYKKNPENIHKLAVDEEAAVDESEWIVVRDINEGIVTQKEFDQANAQEQKEKTKRPAGKQGMDVGSVKAEIEKLEVDKAFDYESYKSGNISRGMFIERKEALGIRYYIHLEEYDKSIMASLIAGAKVMGEECMEVTWKYQDVYEKILGEMQQ